MDGWEGGSGGESPGLVRVGPAVDRPVGPPARPGRVRYFLAPARRRGVAVGRGASTHTPRAPAAPTMPARTPPPDDPAPAARGVTRARGVGRAAGSMGGRGVGSRRRCGALADSLCKQLAAGVSEEAAARHQQPSAHVERGTVTAAAGRDKKRAIAGLRS